MNANSSIRQNCDELSSPNITEDGAIKILTKFLNLLKNPEKYQKDIFINLSDKGLNRLLFMMKHQNETIRKLSFITLINILYNNEVLQNIFCEKFNFNPIGNVICINWLPSIFKEKVSLDTNLILELKKCSSCTSSNTKYWKWPNNPIYTDDLVPDPERYLVGFFYSTKSGGGKIENLNSNYDFQKIIDILEDGYEPTPLNLNLGGNKQEAKKEDYKKYKSKNQSKSIEFQQSNTIDAAPPKNKK